MEKVSGGPAATHPVNQDKYRVLPRAKVPVEEDEIRISMVGRIPRYVLYAARLLNEKGKKSVTIKATGNAIASAITLAEVLKRRFPNIHQQNIIGVTKSVDTYEPIESGLDQVVYARDVPFIEIVIAVDSDVVDAKAVGYQPPIDQSLVRPLIENTAQREGGQSSLPPRGRRGIGGGRYSRRGAASTGETRVRVGRGGRHPPAGSYRGGRGGYRGGGRMYRGGH